jgi:hypothetical protein
MNDPFEYAIAEIGRAVRERMAPDRQRPPVDADVPTWTPDPESRTSLLTDGQASSSPDNELRQCVLLIPGSE